MYYGYKISDYTADLAKKAEKDCEKVFKKIDETALFCSAKVLSAFQECRASTADFIEITGYGYSDSGRDKLEEIYAKIFRCRGCSGAPSDYVGHSRTCDNSRRTFEAR